MFLRTAGLAAATALAANALLLPPNVNADALDSDPRLGVLGVYSKFRMFKAPCVGCPFAVEGVEGVKWTDGVANELVYNFKISDDRQALFLGDTQIYPPQLLSLSLPMYVKQIPSMKEGEFSTLEMPSINLRITDFTLSHIGAETISEDGNELIPITFNVMKLADTPIKKQSLRIFLIKDTSGQLNIANIQLDETVAEGPFDTVLTGDCKTWPTLCKIRETLKHKIDAFRAHRGHRRPCPGHKRPGKFSQGRPTRPHHPRPHHNKHHKQEHHGHHRHHHHHHHSHSMKHKVMVALRHLVRFVLVPLFIGVLCGAIAYFVGWLFGMAVACLYMWARSRRNGGSSGSYSRIALADDEESTASITIYTPSSGNSDAGDAVAPPYSDIVEKEVYVAEEKSADSEVPPPPVYVEIATSPIVIEAPKEDEKK